MTSDMKPRCIIPNCGRKHYGRGLCEPCYKRAKRVMERDKLTWDDLVEMGLCSESVSAPFIRAYEEARKKRE